MVGPRKWRLVLLQLVLAQALALQAVLPFWGHLLQPTADGISVLCRFGIGTPNVPANGQQPRPHHDCLANCLAALTEAVPADNAEIVAEPHRRFDIVTLSHRGSAPERDHLSTSWSARGPPLAA